MPSSDPSPPRWWRRPGALALAVLPLHAAALAALAGAPDLVERSYGRVVFPRVARLHAWLDQTSLSPSVTLGVALLALLAASAARAAARARPEGRARGPAALARAAWLALVAAAVLAHLFPASWGLNYLRPGVAARLGLDPAAPIDPAAWRATATAVVVAANAARVEWGPRDQAEEERAVDVAVRACLARHGLDEALPARTRRARLLPPGLMASGGWTGVQLPWTTEAMVDPALDPRSVPSAMAHEKAHQAGFAREADANFIAFLALVEARDPRLRWSGLFDVAGLFCDRSAVPFQPVVVQDYQAAVVTHQAVEVPVVAAATQQVYDTYLRANQVEAGVADYDRVALLIHAWRVRHPGWLDRQSR